MCNVAKIYHVKSSKIYNYILVWSGSYHCGMIILIILFFEKKNIKKGYRFFFLNGIISKPCRSFLGVYCILCNIFCIYKFNLIIRHWTISSTCPSSVLYKGEVYERMRQRTSWTRQAKKNIKMFVYISI